MSFVKKYCQKRRQKRMLRKFYRNGNHVYLVTEQGTRITNPSRVPGLYVNATGTNNTITIELPIKIDKKLTIALTDNATISIGHHAHFSGPSRISKSRGSAENHVHIGNYCGFGECIIDITDHGNIDIGNNGMFSWGIYIKTDDTHPVFDAATGAVLNRSTGISIGNHVWIGMYATILKNSIIADNSIVGAHSVVAGKFTEPNTALAGNPARVVKTGINWSGKSIEDYCAQNP
ncbi:MAG: acyltransferase [Alphaproteobacteria bacterium]|nr:acyltransferase [Alphaproteobacteria bacterium]